jgi:isopenicillin N synthase-like dioxygenase
MPIIISPPEAPPFYVPTVDIAPYLADPTSAEAEKIIADVRAACISTGFFQITGHGIPRSLQKEVFDAAAAFFALPYGEKKKLDAKTTTGHRGYDVLASQSYEADVMPDLKEVPLPD